MKSRFSFALGLLVGILPGFAGAAERDVEKELAAFAFEGVSLSMPQAEFLRRVDGFASFRTNPETGVATYLAISPKNADAVSYHLLDGKVQKIIIMYLPPRLQDVGGADLVRGKLVERFGIPANSKVVDAGAVWFWEAPRSSRLLCLVVMKKNMGATIIVEDMAGEKIIKERKLTNMHLGIEGQIADATSNPISQARRKPVHESSAILDWAYTSNIEDNSDRIAELQTDIADRAFRESLRGATLTLAFRKFEERTRDAAAHAAQMTARAKTPDQRRAADKEWRRVRAFARNREDCRPK